MTRKATAPYRVQATLAHGGTAVFGVSARNPRKLGFRLARLQGITARLPVAQLAVEPVPGKPKRRKAAATLAAPHSTRARDLRYSQTPGAAAPEWTIAHEIALEA